MPSTKAGSTVVSAGGCAGIVPGVRNSPSAIRTSRAATLSTVLRFWITAPNSTPRRFTSPTTTIIAIASACARDSWTGPSATIVSPCAAPITRHAYSDEVTAIAP